MIEARRLSDELSDYKNSLTRKTKPKKIVYLRKKETLGLPVTSFSICFGCTLHFVRSYGGSALSQCRSKS